MPVEVSREDFEELVDQALESVPQEFWDLVDNVAVIVEDDPPADQPGLLGLYEGVPLTERGDYA
ncbi:MAG: metallopeptidase family protein, partial [Actinomyces sp.]|nr:metallopeptidase family protein [Actinomyces sp.]